MDTERAGVSRALARLEADVGTPLLHRSGRRLRLTHAGVFLKRHVDALVHSLDDGLAAVSQLTDPETGSVTLAFQPSLGTWLVPDLISSFRAAHPRVRFDLRPKRDELAPAVGTRGDVDLELSTLRPVGTDLAWHRLVREPLAAAVPPGHPLAGRSSVTIAQLADEPLVALRPTSLLRRLCDELLARPGRPAAVAVECDDLRTLRGFVAAGLGVALVPAPRTGSSEQEAAAVVHVPVADPAASRDVGLTWSVERRLLPAAQLFREHVLGRAATGQLPGPAALVRRS